MLKIVYVSPKGIRLLNQFRMDHSSLRPPVSNQNSQPRRSQESTT